MSTTELPERVSKIMDICADLIVKAVEDVGEDLIPGEVLYDHFPNIYDHGTPQDVDELEGDFRSLLDLGVEIFLMMVATHDTKPR